MSPNRPGTGPWAWLLQGDALVYYGVKRIHHRGSPHERLTDGKRVVAELIRDLDPDLLA